MIYLRHLLGCMGVSLASICQSESAEKQLQEVHTFSISGPLYFVKIAAVTSLSLISHVNLWDSVHKRPAIQKRHLL